MYVRYFQLKTDKDTKACIIQEAEDHQHTLKYMYNSSVRNDTA